MQTDLLILVCHAADGHFADGDREAVRHLLHRSDYIVDTILLGPEHFELICPDGGVLELRAPGLEGQRSFRRIEIIPSAPTWTPDMLNLVFDLMTQGNFGLMNNLDMPQFIVVQPAQISYFPWLPEPPLLVRTPRDLGYALG